MLPICASMVIKLLLYLFFPVQLRSGNSYSLYNNWSSPIIINLDNVTVTEPTFIPPSEEEQQFPLPIYAYVLIAVAMLLIIVASFLLVCVCIVYVRRNYCIDIVSLIQCVSYIRIL